MKTALIGVVALAMAGCASRNQLEAQLTQLQIDNQLLAKEIDACELEANGLQVMTDPHSSVELYHEETPVHRVCSNYRGAISTGVWVLHRECDDGFRCNVKVQSGKRVMSTCPDYGSPMDVSYQQ